MKTDFSKLPKHWKKKKLKEIVVKQTGVKPIHRFPKEIIGTNLPEWDVEALSSGKPSQFADWYSTIHCFENDILVILSGGRNGLVFKGKNGIAGRALFCLSPLSINSDYLFYYLKYREFEHKTERNLSPSFWEMEIPIPPIEEQKHIAQSIQATYQNFETQNQEAEKNLLDSFKKLVPIQSETLDKIIGLEDFKKSVLDLAVSGKLTEKWRLKNSLTFDWKKVVLNDIGFLVTGESIPSSNVNTVGLGTIYITGPEQLRNPEIKKWTSFPKKIVEEESVFITVKGVAVGEIFRGLLNVCIGRDIYAYVPNKTYFEKDYDLIALKTLKNSILDKSKGVIPGITKLDILEFELNLPSLEEQTEIVRIVETIFAEADKIQQDFDLQKKREENLLKSGINIFFQSSNFPIAQTDWDLDTQIKEAREKKEMELAELKKKQKAFQNTLFNFGDMKKDDKERIKKKIKEVAHNDFSSFEVLTEKEIDLLRDSVKGTSKNFTDEDFATVFLEMTQELFDDEKQKEGNDKPFFESTIINNDTLAFKFQK